MAISARSLEFVWLWFLESSAGLRMREQHLLSDSPSADQLEPFWIGLTRDELKEVFSKLHGELDQNTCLALMTMAEAALRADFQSRTAHKGKDPLSRVFRETKRRRREKIRLSEDILQAWSDKGVNLKIVIGEFRGALKLRDWLAHGQYWPAKFGRRYDARTVHGVVATLLGKTGVSTN